MKVLESSSEALSLAERLIKRRAMPPTAKNDALHLAIAAVAGMEYLLTWNYRHLANASLRALLERVCKKARYACPTVCTPLELLGD
jgi:hypothetical protein